MAVETPKTVFFHVPKTGGCTVRQILQANQLVLRELGTPHSYPTGLVLPSGKTTWCYTRHPAAWYVSLWVYKEYCTDYIPEHGWGTDQDEWMLAIADRDFRSFLGKALNTFDEGVWTIAMKPYVTNVDVVLKQEFLRPALCALLYDCRESFAPHTIWGIPRANVSPRMREYRKRAKLTETDYGDIWSRDWELMAALGYEGYPPEPSESFLDSRDLLVSLR